MKITNKILEGPCVFCGYEGGGYWFRHTHSRNCPFYGVEGKKERAKAFAAGVRKVWVVADYYKRKSEFEGTWGKGEV